MPLCGQWVYVRPRLRSPPVMVTRVLLWLLAGRLVSALECITWGRPSFRIYSAWQSITLLRRRWSSDYLSHFLRFSARLPQLVPTRRTAAREQPGCALRLGLKRALACWPYRLSAQPLAAPSDDASSLARSPTFAAKLLSELRTAKPDRRSM